MIRPERERPKKLFRGAEFGRLMTMVCMLFVLGMMIQTARNPGTWQWLVKRPGKTDRVVADLDRHQQKVIRETPVASNHEPRAAAAAIARTKHFADREIAMISPEGIKADKSVEKTPADVARPAKADLAKSDESKTDSVKNDSTKSDSLGGDSTEPSSPPNSGPSNTDAISNGLVSPYTGKPNGPSSDAGKAGVIKPSTTNGADHAAPAPVAELSAEQRKLIDAPAATGPTDEDEEEQQGAAQDFDFVVDNQLNDDRRDHPAYQRIFRWVIDQPFDRLEARAKDINPPLAQFVAAPSDFRGKIFELEVHARRVLKLDQKFKFYDEENPQEPVTYYEMWGTTDESRTHLLNFIIYDPPEGMPLGPTINEDVRFVGYFFRVQGYLPAKAPPGARTELAPSFIGRIAWKKVAAAQAFHTDDMPFLWIIVGGVAVLGAGWLVLMYFLTRRGRAEGASTGSVGIPRSVTIDDWLETNDLNSAGHETEEPHEDHRLREVADGNGVQRGRLGIFDEPPGGRHRDN